ncbi:Uncharacterised protein [Serratia proteamaculans]|uniref:hypothetical protein n=1 Tax=Serratia proteamaculans TaxID=28151 RepID=UPI0021835362|nr:hypothetical protein [Serratia proteamaculans]CAI2428436.1 Uncharacterised protein [Serratia proteamaculans]
MDAAKIHAKIYAGRGKAALRLGLLYDVMRPVMAADPFTQKVTRLNAAFNNTDNKYLKANHPGDPLWYGDLDGRQTQPGDYLVGANSTYFIAAQQQLLPIICVECNRTVRMTRPVAPVPESEANDVSVLPYSGMCQSPDDSEDVLGTSPVAGGAAVGWPASVLFGKGRLRSNIGLKAGTSEQLGWQIMLPVSVPVVFHPGDVLTDDLGTLFSVSSAELSDTGWRIQAIEVHV